MEPQLLCWAWPFAEILKHAVYAGPKLLPYCVYCLWATLAVCTVKW